MTFPHFVRLLSVASALALECADASTNLDDGLCFAQQGFLAADCSVQDMDDSTSLLQASRDVQRVLAGHQQGNVDSSPAQDDIGKENQQRKSGALITRRIALMGGAGDKYCADEGTRVVCNRDKIRAWETFEAEIFDGEYKYAIKGGQHKKYCRVVTGVLKCDADDATPSMEFYEVKNDRFMMIFGVKNALQNQYLTVDPHGVIKVGLWEDAASFKALELTLKPFIPYR